ncbi:hypothetical protein Heshes_07000 [Alicyclobacillus hesperidum]|uniref:Uncharacterized protein n=1 Tax=Alicyclobacillus hesperidum TaxID=89784 RepID=A0A1H2WY07_9BACL|nr:hypothetical protein [Alicyclobacillus hesperidum]GLV13016.1 hypothetical protein Heshes_07000 [Alicyclobacillus hesperidum]SDW85500.1 hypothetical protein SAMN04489725_11737 [Alicyclobacillus hesperidum]
MSPKRRNDWAWPVIGGIGVGLSTMFVCMPQSREAMADTIERALNSGQRRQRNQQQQARGSQPYAP